MKVRNKSENRNKNRIDNTTNLMYSDLRKRNIVEGEYTNDKNFY